MCMAHPPNDSESMSESWHHIEHVYYGTVHRPGRHVLPAELALREVLVAATSHDLATLSAVDLERRRMFRDLR
jgi:hypothetical protein